MGFSGKVLAEGQLPNSKTTLYTVPGSTTAYVKYISCYNNNTTDETAKIYLKPGSTSRQIGIAVLGEDEMVRFVDKDEALILEAGDIIEGETTTASQVDYVILGIEET